MFPKQHNCEELNIAERAFDEDHPGIVSEWVAVYLILRDVEDRKLWSQDYDSFHLWLKAYCERRGVKTYPVYRRRLKAGRFYEEAFFKGGDFPPIEKLAVSAENVLLIEKISSYDEEEAKTLMKAAIDGTIGRKDLDGIYSSLRGYESSSGDIDAARLSSEATAQESDQKRAELYGLSQSDMWKILSDKNSWIYERANYILGDEVELTIDPSAQELLVEIEAGQPRGEEDLWKDIRKFIYDAKDKADNSKGNSFTLTAIGRSLELVQGQTDNTPTRSPLFELKSSTITKRGPKPQRWYDRNTAKLIDTLVQLRINVDNVSSDTFHQIAAYLSKGTDDLEFEVTYDDREAAHLIWFAMIGINYAAGYFGRNGEISIGSMNGIIENGNKILKGNKTRLDYLFYSTESEGRMGFEERLYKGEIQLTRIAVEALSSYRRYRELTLKQRERSAKVASSMLNRALLDSIHGASCVPDDLEQIAEGR